VTAPRHGGRPDRATDGMQPRTVLVGVDGSPSAMRAVRWGAAEAARRETPLRLVLAFAWPHAALRRPGGQEEVHRDVLVTAAREQLDVAAAAALRDEPGLDVQQQLIVGSPIPVLAEEAGRAQLLVLGDRGLGRVEGLLVGSVAGALAPHASCPVVVVRGGDDPPASLPVVVGVDGHSDDAIAFAFEAAAARRVSVVAVHSWWQPVFEPEMAGVLFDREAIQAEEERILAQRLAGWAEKYPGVVVERWVIADSPARGLLAQAGEAQLVVVGSRGRGALASMVLGSVGNVLLHRSPCPVAVVRPETAQ
jgi:nucleotide-binding universal stress UspA family protein